MSFYPGVLTNHYNMCSTPLVLVPKIGLKQQQNIVLTSNDYACEYRIQTPKLTYRNTGKVWIWIEQMDNIELYVFKGNSHSNLTLLIENNQTAGIGSPVQVPVDDGAVIIAQVRAFNSFQRMLMGSFTFSYKLEGETYPWYENMFLGR